jgi:circadian clock protein KaiB
VEPKKKDKMRAMPRSAKRSTGAGGSSATLLRKLKKAAHTEDDRYLLRLYVTGNTPASQRAIERARQVCEKHLHGRHQLDVIDIYQLPALAKDEQIIATPTLVKVLPAPLRRFVGDVSRIEKVLFGIDVRR